MMLSFRSSVVAAAFAASTLMSAAPAFSQVNPVDPREFTIGGMIGGQLMEVGRTLSEFRQFKANFTAEIDAARRRYWSLYPNRPGFPEAATAFSRKLADKDLYLLLDPNFSNREAAGKLMNLFDNLSGGPVDGGIPALARPAFFAWVRAVNQAGGRTQWGVATDAQLTAPASMEAYRAYVTKRDLAELLDGPASPLLSKDDKTYLTAVLVRANRLSSLGEGERQYAAMLDLLGDPAIRDLVSVLRRELRLPAFDLPNSDVLGILERNASVLAFISQIWAKQLAETTDDRTYLTLQLAVVHKERKHVAGTTYYWIPALDWVKGREVYLDLVKRHGDSRVAKFANELRQLWPEFMCPSQDDQSTCLLPVFAEGGERAFLTALERSSGGAQFAAARRALAVDSVRERAARVARNNAARAAEQARLIDEAPSMSSYTVAPRLLDPAAAAELIKRHYPAELRGSGIAGRVGIWLRIDETGKVLRAQAERSSGNAALDQAALKLAPELRFSPAELRGEKVRVWVVLPISFTAQ